MEAYLYGSAARGEVRWDSDIDLLLVLDPSQKNKKGRHFQAAFEIYSG